MIEDPGQRQAALQQFISAAGRQTATSGAGQQQDPGSAVPHLGQPTPQEAADADDGGPELQSVRNDGSQPPDGSGEAQPAGQEGTQQSAAHELAGGTGATSMPPAPPQEAQRGAVSEVRMRELLSMCCMHIHLCTSPCVHRAHRTNMSSFGTRRLFVAAVSRARPCIGTRSAASVHLRKQMQAGDPSADASPAAAGDSAPDSMDQQEAQPAGGPSAGSPGAPDSTGHPAGSRSASPDTAAHSSQQAARDGAATTIQANIRGYLARKSRRVRPAQQPAVAAAAAPAPTGEELPDLSSFSAADEASIAKVQNSFRGKLQRKRLGQSRAVRDAHRDSTGPAPEDVDGL